MPRVGSSLGGTTTKNGMQSSSSYSLLDVSLEELVRVVLYKVKSNDSTSMDDRMVSSESASTDPIAELNGDGDSSGISNIADLISSTKLEDVNDNETSINMTNPKYCTNDIRVTAQAVQDGGYNQRTY